MTQYFKQITIVLLGMVFMLMISWFFVGSLKRDTESFNLVEALRSTAISNKDDSARIQPGAFYLNEENFEKEFTESVKKQPIYAKEAVNISFNYLRTDDGKGIKAIRAYVEVNSQVEEATCVLSTPEGGG
ncbi:hypothetical protein [Enterococcus sp. RIT-PI-f]|uniref:hypothetical protein n=1 Tax=Enterococcus sp. RIT-PI-f TaxID=1690244 RepID=UPI0006B9533D|nr:hypothetical protein [Enterococcus sp. RIT-PI-f]KPG70833.1 hypothetical protein AEQ18_06515 [Enterococcus sp. RIT-PI-f]